MNKILMAMIFSAACVAATSASAQLYIGGVGGTATSDVPHTSSKVFLGMQVSSNFGFEAAYTDFGGYRGASANAVSFLVVGTLPLGDTWDLFARWGTTQNHTNYAGVASNTDFLTGFGVAYNISKNVSVRLEAESYGKLPSDANGISSTVTNWGGGVKYLF